MKAMAPFDARISDGPDMWAMDRATLQVRWGDAFLMNDGTWQTVAEGESLSGTGVVVPRGAIPAIAAAIAEWQGDTGHAATESKVLREWLAVEQRRVDEVLKR